MSREYDPIERSYQDLEPEMAAARERERLSGMRKERALRANRKDRASRLLDNDDFVSWLSTEVERAGIFSPTFHPHEGNGQYLAGVRGFVLAMISDLEKLDPGIWVRLSLERAKTIKEGDNDRHDTDDRDPE